MTRKILKLPAVMARTGKSRSTIYRGMENKAFPLAVVLGENSVGWYSDEIDDYVESRPRVILSAPAPKGKPPPSATQPAVA